MLWSNLGPLALQVTLHHGSLAAWVKDEVSYRVLLCLRLSIIACIIIEITADKERRLLVIQNQRDSNPR